MTNIQHLYSALRKQGLTRQKLAHILPEWWSDEIEATPSGAQQAKLYLAKALSLRIRPFSETPPRVEFDLPVERRFKRSAKTTDADIEVAVALAQSASRIALSALDREFIPPLPSAAAIRTHILGRGDNWVGLSQLLEYCWGCGIPVLHLATPLLGKKMDGIAMSIKGRPSVVLSNRRVSGFLLFHLAHELGHIALGHVAENGAIVDDEITKGDAGAERDPQEVAADRFAIELLTGNADGRLTLQRRVFAPQLAEMAVRYGRENHIDPTHVVLNCAFNDNNIFPLCVAAANLIAGERTDQAAVTQAAYDNLIDGLNPDSEHLLRNLIA
ncbi:ImmA/IrrE family metallo-endopeptidase [Pseudomonas sp. GCM10022186]|uniref:ImmA/IrrE family metallo-endopeptidase n=1 Tax=Pseudomonas sp. GCM10022186 TaxID=3252650 RepID=UPI00362034AB